MNANTAMGFALLVAVIALIGLGLRTAARRNAVIGNPLADRILEHLPHTQCAQCGFPGCRPYAEAIASGDAEINRCPPGGEQTIRVLAALLDRDVLPLDRGNVPDFIETDIDLLAVVREDECIGCTLCIKACPVDAIVGAHHRMHTIIASECTGCGLCLPPCPVDCIDLVEAPEPGRQS